MFSTIKLAAAVALSALLAVHSADAALVTKCTTAKTIALAFDDAFQHPQLENLLTDLKKYGIVATFFVVPSNDATFCDSIKKIMADGHQIENHSWSHGHVGSMSASQLQSEITKVETAVQQCGDSTKMTAFRPPYLETGGSVMSVCNQLGYDVVTCNVNSDDYDNISLDQAWSNIQNGISQAGGSAVILEHQWTYKQGNTMGIIQKYADTYKAQGYKFVTVTECAGHGGQPQTTQPQTTKPQTTKPSNPTTAPASSGNGQKRWGQCGGNGWSGATTCAEGSCVKLNDWYSQCQ
jgi:peptidoglycan/xylan/chitin deacetylase (PgdA/CDA1 family)